jgi:hypothetical protein
VALEVDFWEEKDRVSVEERVELERPFSETEIKEVVFSCYDEGGPGPDGLPFLFYQKFWDLVKGDLTLLVSNFYSGDLDLFRLNFANILIPKVTDALEMKNFRPISLLNCNFKIFGKPLTMRLEKM